jgi:hypothetical protein
MRPIVQQCAVLHIAQFTCQVKCCTKHGICVWRCNTVSNQASAQGAPCLQWLQQNLTYLEQQPKKLRSQGVSKSISSKAAPLLQSLVHTSAPMERPIRSKVVQRSARDSAVPRAVQTSSVTPPHLLVLGAHLRHTHTIFRHLCREPSPYYGTVA